MDKEILIKARQVKKSYHQGVSELPILRGIDLDIFRGDAVAILGASGTGKSTLLHLLGTLDRPDEGQIFYQDQNLTDLNDDEISKFRNLEMGFVFQFHHLMSELNAIENILLPAKIGRKDLAIAEAKAIELLSLMGLLDRKDHYPNELSGGELQRVAIARALINEPRVLFADEPTGNLDSKNSILIQELFFELQKKLNLSLVVVTHDLSFAAKFPRVLRLKDGQWEKSF